MPCRARSAWSGASPDGPRRPSARPPAPGKLRAMSVARTREEVAAALREHWHKERWYRRPYRPWNLVALRWELARRKAFARGRLHGDVLAMLRDGRLELGEQVFFEDGVWMTAGPEARIRIGGGSFLNLTVMLAAETRIDIGEHCMLANGCMVTDAAHRFSDPDVPVPWQGFTTKGPTSVGANTWLGAHVVVTSGVTIGERCVVGANSVVTRDLPPRTIAAGVPAKPIGEVAYARADGASEGGA